MTIQHHADEQLTDQQQVARMRRRLLDVFDDLAEATHHDPHEIVELLGPLLAVYGLINPDPELGERVDVAWPHQEPAGRPRRALALAPAMGAPAPRRLR